MFRRFVKKIETKFNNYLQDFSEYVVENEFIKLIKLRIIQTNPVASQTYYYSNNYYNSINIPYQNQFMNPNFTDYKKEKYQNMTEKTNNNKYNNYKNLVSPEKRHLRGLVNIASTCYMNSILQCFCNIKELAVYFQTEKMNQLVSYYQYDNNKLFTVFQEVIKQLWDPYDNSAYSPYNFKNRLGDMNPLFRGAYPNDAKDLLTFLLLQLHEELNKPKNNDNNDNNALNINAQNDKKLMFKNFTKFFSKNYRSIISELFYGAFYTETTCNFGHKFYNYQTFNFIIFPLEKVLQFKMNSNNNFNPYNNTVTLEDCF